jgi:hypothetical protein
MARNEKKLSLREQFTFGRSHIWNFRMTGDSSRRANSSVLKREQKGQDTTTCFLSHVKEGGRITWQIFQAHTQKNSYVTRGNIRHGLCYRMLVSILPMFDFQYWSNSVTNSSPFRLRKPVPEYRIRRKTTDVMSDRQPVDTRYSTTRLV